MNTFKRKAMMCVALAAFAACGAAYATPPPDSATTPSYQKSNPAAELYIGARAKADAGIASPEQANEPLIYIMDFNRTATGVLGASGAATTSHYSANAIAGTPTRQEVASALLGAARWESTNVMS